MERKIGEIFECNGEWYQCVVAIQGCRGCFFRTRDYCTRHSECLAYVRSDKTSVIFKKLEKVGEPFIINGKKYQTYITHVRPYILNEPNSMPVDDSIVVVEIKQNKEDMEEKKLSLKPFDIQKAREGKPVCTRDGRKARIICFDRNASQYSIVALVEHKGFPNKEEEIKVYTNEGKCFADEENSYDLMMLPEKKEGWVNVYKMKESTFGYITAYFDTEEKAKEDKEQLTGYVATVKINWEE